jgi:hypothetical protein
MGRIREAHPARGLGRMRFCGHIIEQMHMDATKRVAIFRKLQGEVQGLKARE